LGSQAIAQFTYDSGGRLTSTALGNGLQESKSYRNDNLLSSMTTTAVGTITHSYDGDKRKLTEAGTAVSGDQTFAYDNGGRLTSWQRGFPGLRNQSWVLSPVGDWVSTSRDGETENRTHDAAHELTQIDSKPLTYDPRGNLVQDDILDSLTWDFENRLLTFKPGDDATVSYLYDVLGR